MIYYVDHIETVSEAELREFCEFLSEQRRQKVARYRFHSDKVQSALVYILLRFALHREYGIRELPQLSYEQHGKPFLTEWKQIHFNLSHCKKAVACGLSHAPLGIDVQNYVPFKEAIASYFMTPEEQALARATDPDREFTRLWTLKESYGKYLGSGICYDMTSMPVIENQQCDGYISQSHALANVYLSVTAAQELALIEITLDELREFCNTLKLY